MSGGEKGNDLARTRREWDVDVVGEKEAFGKDEEDENHRRRRGFRRGIQAPISKLGWKCSEKSETTRETPTHCPELQPSLNLHPITLLTCL